MARHLARHALRHAVNDVVPCLLALFAHEATKGGRAREQDSLLREELLGAFMEGRRLLQARVGIIRERQAGFGEMRLVSVFG